jgi:chromosome segregation ATPase
VATALLRDRFAALGRPHQLDAALRETARQEQRLRIEADARDGVVESLRRSLEEVLQHRDELLAEQQRHAVQEAAERRRSTELEVASAALRQALGDSEDRAARLEAAALDDRRLLAQQAQSAAEGAARMAETEAALAARDAETRRLRAETEILRGHLTAARADVTAAREGSRAQLARLQAVLDARESEMAALYASAGWRLTVPP